MISIPTMELASEQAEALGLDRLGFRAFYDEALPRVYGYLLRRCGGAVALAEDLTQETFLAAVAELKKGRRVEAPIPWIHGIARHKLVDHYRRQERDERLRQGVGPDPCAPVQDRIGEETDDGALAALAALPAAQRAALVLRHADGLSVPEIAALLGRSVGAVESLLARGRASFRRLYQEVLR
jgi:RNA polymerase sigma-70 factor (ECF subfamily)